jgi:hypothetical protein
MNVFSNCQATFCLFAFCTLKSVSFGPIITEARRKEEGLYFLSESVCVRVRDVRKMCVCVRERERVL